MKKLKLLIAVIILLYANISIASNNKDISENNTKVSLAVSDYFKTLIPKPIHKNTSINLYENLEYRHFKSLKLNDQLSSDLFDKYLSNLDNSKIYFIESDINEFEKFRYQFDTFIKRGELRPAYKIFNRYQKRIIERLIFMLNKLECCFNKINFSAIENYETERENISWAKNESELDKLWEKRLKNDILSLKLADKAMPEIRETLTKRYKYRLKRSGQLKSEDAFRSYMNSFTSLYDPHTVYFSPRDSEDFNIHMSLSLEGIGALLQSDEDYTKVLRIIPAGPADKSKLLKAGDRIIGVGQGLSGEIVDVIGWRLDDVVQLIRGTKKTIVQLKIMPATAPDDQHTKIINITRNTVKLEEQSASKKLITIKSQDKDYKIGVITIPTFYVDFNGYHSNKENYKSTTRDVRKLITELKKENIDGIIIDIRNNGGGSLDEVVTLTGLFIKTGPTVIVRQGTKHRVVHPDNDPEILYDGPLAVLVNRMSASASEIFAGAIKDHKRGLILGTQTFGKGTVQSLFNLNQGQLKLTIAKFYRILGESTQNKGVMPDISFPSVYNFDEIGESALDAALPWDTTHPENFKPFLNIDMKPVIEKIKISHEKRIKSSADYKYLVQFNDHYKELQKKTQISLNEDIRKNELKKSRQFILDIENELKISKGEIPYKDYQAYKDEQIKNIDKENTSEEEKEESEENTNSNDFILTESELILIDFIKILNL